MPSSNKGGTILTTIVVLVALLLLAAWIGPQIFIVYSLRNMRQANPGLQLVPHPMPAVSAAPVTSERHSCYGYEFLTPWGKPDVIPGEYSAGLYFPGGVAMYFRNPAKAIDFFSAVRHQKARQVDMERIFGRHDIDSSYGALQAVMEATPPAEVSFFRNREQALWTFMILTQKGMDVHYSTTDILSFELENLRGFQINDSKQDGKSIVHAFDKKDAHLEFEFFRPGDAQKTLVPQAEINAVLLSIRLASPVQKPPPKKAN